MHQHTCLNCAHPFAAGDRYCARCSQPANTHRLTLGHLLHEVLHAVTHADKGFLVLLRDLALRPGGVARDYAEGKRKRHFSPFSFVLLCLSLFLIINNTFHPLTPALQPNPAVLAQLPTPAARAQYTAVIARMAQATEMATQKNNMVYLIAIPVYALVLWLLFRRRNFAEHLVANLYFNGFLALVSACVLLPVYGLLPAGKGQFVVMAALFLFQIGYLTVAYYQFLGCTRRRSYLKITAAVILVVLIWLALTGFALLWYVTEGNLGPALRGLLHR